MALHLVPFVAGAVIGGLGVHFYRDRKVRNAVTSAAKQLPGQIKRTADDVSEKVSETYGDLRERVTGSEKKAAPAKKRPARKTSAQKTAASKTAAKKTAGKTTARKKTTAKKADASKDQPATS